MKNPKRILFVLFSVSICVVLILCIGRSHHVFRPVSVPSAADASVPTQATLPPSTEPETTEAPIQRVPRKVRKTKKSSDPIAAFEAQALRYTNEERRKHGLRPLNPSNRLLSSARIRAVEITQSFSHVRPDGQDCFSLDPGFFVGENIAWGQVSAREVVTDWMNSPSHRENILCETFELCAIGCYYNEADGIYYWAQLFA